VLGSGRDGDGIAVGAGRVAAAGTAEAGTAEVGRTEVGVPGACGTVAKPPG
jgi:hypothetical protein